MTVELLRFALIASGVALVLGSLPKPASRIEPAESVKRVSTTERIGHGIRERVGLAPAGALVDLRWGRTLWALLLVVIHPALPVVTVLVLWAQPVLAHRRSAAQTDTQVWQSDPEVANVIALAVRSGATIEQAIELVGQRVPGVGGATFAVAATQLQSGVLMADVLAGIDDDLGEPVHPLCRALTSAMQGGTQLVPALERVADELRRHDHQRKLRHAHRVPVALLFPLVTCTLPAFALLTVVPLIATSVSQLTG